MVRLLRRRHVVMFCESIARCAVVLSPLRHNEPLAWTFRALLMTLLVYMVAASPSLMMHSLASSTPWLITSSLPSSVRRSECSTVGHI